MEIQFELVVLIFTLYYFVERYIRHVLRSSNNSMYESLIASGKDRVFFGIAMGALITVVSTPFCMRAAVDSSPFSTGLTSDGLRRPLDLDFSAQTCIVARSVLWVSELNRLDMYPLYVIHHGASIVSLLSFLYLSWPPAVFLAFYATLGSEIPGDFVWLLSAVDSPSATLVRFRRFLIKFNVVQYTIIRGAGILMVIALLIDRRIGFHERPLLEQIHGYVLMAMYTLFCASYVFRQARSLNGPSSTEDSSSTSGDEKSQPPSHREPFHLRLPTSPTIIIVPYGPLMGLGFASLVLCVFALAPSPSSHANLPATLVLTLVQAVLGARLFSVFLEDGGFAALRARPLKTLLRPGFWLHGGLLGAGTGGVSAFALGFTDLGGLTRVAGAMMVGLPLYEFWSRIGCHTFGCCYGMEVACSEEGADRHRRLKEANGPGEDIVKEIAKSAGPPSPSPASTVKVAPHHMGLLWGLFPFSAVVYDHPTFFAATRLEPWLLGRPLVPIQLITASLSLLTFLAIGVPLISGALLGGDTAPTALWVAGLSTLATHGVTRLITERWRADFRGGTRASAGRAAGAAEWSLSTTGKIALAQTALAALALGCVLSYGPTAAAEVVSTNEGWEMGLRKLVGVLFAAAPTAALAIALGTVVYGVHVGQVGAWVARQSAS